MFLIMTKLYKHGAYKPIVLLKLIYILNIILLNYLPINIKQIIIYMKRKK